MKHLWNEYCPTNDGDGTDLAPVHDEAEALLRACSFGPQRKLVLALLLDGLSEKQTAAQLHMRASTVHWHTVEIYEAFDVQTRAELAAHFRHSSTIPQACASEH